MLNITIPNIGERVEYASRFIPKCNNLLDIGCETGILKNFIQDKKVKLYGLDNNIKALKICKSIYFNVKKYDINLGKFPYKSTFFGCAVCLDVIEHILDPNLLLMEIHRVLKKRGILIISTPNIRFSDHLLKLLFSGKFPKTSTDSDYYDGGHIHFFTYSDMETMLYQNGFEILKKEGIINKNKRGWKGRLVESLIGKNLMNEFRSPGILLVAQKV